MKTLSLLPLALLLPLLPANGLLCSLQGTNAVAICAMCSHAHAAVRWTVEFTEFRFWYLRYTCTDLNGTVLYENIQTDDNCFTSHPIASISDPRTGVASVGYDLWTGIECKFTVYYRIDEDPSYQTATCTIQSPEACAANPESCQIDRVSVMNEDGECPEHQCAEGYGGELCNNVNECETNNTCDEYADCHDTDGSYWCKCSSGFLGDGYNCTDIDECVSLNETCLDENAHCVNSMGNFSCQCDPGFTGDGYNCSDVDECLEEGVCHTMATCANTEGSVECKCRSGYSGDGYECSDINECALLSGSCDENALCTNIEGSYECKCKEGFQGDGYTICTDIDECDEGSHSCHSNSTCYNLLGTYQCKCLDGFFMIGDYNCTTVQNSTSSTASADSVAAVVSAGTIAVGILLLTTVVLGLVCTGCFKSERPSFQVLTKMDLDPYYTPSFWKGSLTSFHSIYEKLAFSEPATDITHYSENCEQQTNIQSGDCASVTTVHHVIALVPPSPTVEPTHEEPCTQTQTTDYQPGEPSLQNQDELSPPATNTNSTAARDASMPDATSISDILAALEGNDTVSEIRVAMADTTTKTSGTTCHTESVYVTGRPSILMEGSDDVQLKPCPRQRQSSTSSGYINISDSDVHRNQEQMHLASHQKKFPSPLDSCSDCKGSNNDKTDEVISRHRIVMSSSNYVTVFVGENEPGACDREEEPCNTDALEQNGQLDNLSTLYYTANGTISDSDIHQYQEQMHLASNQKKFPSPPDNCSDCISRHRIVMSSSNYVTEFVGENEPDAYDREEEPAQHHPNADFGIVSKCDIETLPTPTVLPSTQTNSSSVAETQRDNYIRSSPSPGSSSGCCIELTTWDSQMSLRSNDGDIITIPSADMQELHLDSAKSTLNTYIQGI